MNAAIAAASAAVAGAWVGEQIGPGDGHAPFLASLAIALVASALPGSARRAAIVSVGVALVASGCMQRALDGWERHRLPMEETATFEGVLVGDPTARRFSTTALLRVERVADQAIEDRVVRVRSSADAAMLLGPLASGDRARVTGRLEPLSGYDERFRWRHAVAVLRVQDLTHVRGPTDPLDRVANALRDVVFRGMRGLPATERALLAGFLLGDTRALPEETEDAFRAAGLTHLLAVSGANVAFVLAIARPALSRLGRGGQFCGGLAVVLLVGATTRWEPSVMRAAVMAALTMWAVYLGRPQAALRILALAVTALVAIDPFLIHSVGFVLSVGATLGIVTLGPPIHRWLRGPNWFREGVSTTAAAQIATAPVLLMVFGTVPLIAVPANLLAGVVAGPLTTWGLAASVIGGLVTPIAALAQIPTGWLTRAELAVADAAAHVPIEVDARGAWCAVAASAATALLVRRHRRALLGRSAVGDL